MSTLLGVVPATPNSSKDQVFPPKSKSASGKPGIENALNHARKILEVEVPEKYS
jgi:hypothetical protein